MATDFGKRLRAARKHAHLTQVQLASLAGISQSTLTASENSAFGSRHTPQLAMACGVDAHWLATGEGQMLPVAKSLLSEPSSAYSLPAESGEHAVLSVPLLANAGSMGTGTETLHDDVVMGRMTLNQAWISRALRGISRPENLRFVHGYGDSMEPTFSDGDILLVDGGVQQVDVDGIYVLKAHDRLFIKRVRQRMDGKFEISSDNPTVKTADVLDGGHEVQVLGKVAWIWNGKRF